jgi:HSP20 family protein
MAVLVRRHTHPSQPIGRQSPMTELDELQQQMAQLMQSLVQPVAGEAAPLPWVPTVDVEETDDAWLFEVELPGAEKGDVNVSIEGDELSVTGEIRERERTGILRRRTRRTGAFEFRATLPGRADAEHVKADLEHGLLSVRVPKADQTQTRRIEVGGHNGASEGAPAQQEQPES